MENLLRMCQTFKFELTANELLNSTVKRFNIAILLRCGRLYKRLEYLVFL